MGLPLDESRQALSKGLLGELFFQKVQETLNSIEGIKPAHAPDDLYDKVKARIEEKTEKGNSKLQFIVSGNYLLRVACAFAGLIFFNFLILQTKGKEQRNEGVSDNNTSKLVAETYFSTTNFNY